MATVFSWNNTGLFLVLSVWHVLMPGRCNWDSSLPKGTTNLSEPIWAGRIVLVAADPARCSPVPSQLWDSKAATSGDADLGTWGFQVPCSGL